MARETLIRGLDDRPGGPVWGTAPAVPCPRRVDAFTTHLRVSPPTASL